MDAVLGIDIGGTSIKAGLFTTDGELLEQSAVPTPALACDEAYAVVTDGLVALLATRGLGVGDVVACGLDVPGPVDDRGRVGVVSNMELDADGLLAAIRSAFPRAAVAFVNDANAAALGELWAGGAKGVSSFVLIAIGTGVGAGIVANGRLVAGSFGAGGEIGHVIVNDDETLPCGCGRRGCLEQYTSAKGIVRGYLAECEARGVEPAAVGHAADTLTVFEALAAGDECARVAVEHMCNHLARAMAQVSCVVDPALFLIGGGVAGAFPAFAAELRERFQRYCFPACRGTKIEAASLGNQAAMYGCAYEALRMRRDGAGAGCDRGGGGGR